MTKLNSYFLHIFIFFAGLSYSIAQTSPDQHREVINLYNPSFEDMPRNSKPPVGWSDCGFPGESPPDTQPDATFKVAKGAQDGDSYLGMVTRDNDTWESVAQRLSRPLRAGKCYRFSIFLARSESYYSVSQLTEQEVNYDTPSTLRIWGGAGKCDKRELLAETSVIAHTRWLEYNFKFEPRQTHTYLLLEATYQMPVLFPTNGNLLLDNASPILLIECDKDLAEVPSAREPEPELAPEEKTFTPPSVVSQEPRPKPNLQTPPTSRPPIAKAEPPSKPAEKKPKILEELDRSKLRQGQIIQISQLYFEADTFSLKENSYEVLDEIYGFLNSNQDVVVEIGGHTNGIPEHQFCDWLSEKRAKEVADYLSRKGISTNRLQYRGYGKRMPIASNKTPVGRKRNQRVEIKILSIDG